MFIDIQLSCFGVQELMMAFRVQFKVEKLLFQILEENFKVKQSIQGDFPFLFKIITSRVVNT